MADPAAQPVLDLTTDRTRQFVRIDKRSIDLRDRQDLVFRDYKRIERISQRLQELEAVDTLNDAETAEHAELLRDVCVIALIDPPKGLVARLDVAQRAAISTVFFELLAKSLPPPRANQAAQGPAGGMKFSRGSRGSTRSTRKRGSRGSR